MYTKNLNNLCILGYLIYDLSDHLPIFFIIQRNCKRTFLPKKIICSIKNFNAEAFFCDISIKVQSSAPTEDFNLAIKNLFDGISIVVENHAPLKQL